jgi:mannan endo-1,4-beta-mannosidase
MKNTSPLRAGALAFGMLALSSLGAQGKVATPWTLSLADKAVKLDAASGGPWEIELEFPKSKMYIVSLALRPLPTAVSANVLVNGEPMERLKLAAGAAEAALPPIYFDEGVQTLGIEIRKGSMEILSLGIKDSLKMHSGPPRSAPANPNAGPQAKRLLAFLAGEYGKHILSGQQDLTWADGVDMAAKVKAMTGREPAIMGYDFLNYISSPDGGNGLRQVEEAIAWSGRGGIVAFCWHWRAGPQKEFYSGKTDFRIDMDPNGESYKWMVADIDAIALQLKRLEAAGVAVLWRPLHEASGGWFWWGASGPKPYIALWNLIYDRMTNVHGLNNLVWVWNGQNADWYPGDATVDVVGVDIYGGDRMYNSWKDSWVNAQSYVRGDEARVVALSENGPIPDPDLLVAEGAPWSWFMTWNDGVQGKPEDDFFSGNKYMDDAHRKKVYNHPYVLTLDELPDLGK